MKLSEDEAKAFVSKLCDQAALEKLAAYVDGLRAENERQNLVSRRSLDEVWARHIADSAQLLGYVPRETSSWLDLGSGPGLPGLILAIMRPHAQFILVESRKKRTDWLVRVAEELNVANVSIEASRLENVETFSAGAITARAFAPLPRLIALSQRFSTGDTIWVLPKGRSAEQELAQLPKPIRSMFHVEHSITKSDAGIIVGKLPTEGKPNR